MIAHCHSAEFTSSEFCLISHTLDPHELGMSHNNEPKQALPLQQNSPIILLCDFVLRRSYHWKSCATIYCDQSNFWFIKKCCLNKIVARSNCSSCVITNFPNIWWLSQDETASILRWKLFSLGVILLKYVLTYESEIEHSRRLSTRTCV